MIMNRVIKFYLLISTVIASALLGGCTSPEEQAKSEIAKRLSDSEKKIDNLSIEVYQGLLPVVFDKDVLSNAFEYSQSEKTKNGIQKIIDESPEPDSYATENILFNYKRGAYRAELDRQSSYRKLKKNLEQLNNSKPQNESLIAIAEYDEESATKREHKVEIFVIDKENPTKIIETWQILEQTPQKILCAIQACIGDTIIVKPTKQELSDIINNVKDPVITYLFKDSIK
ncbi:MAG: hypothetical protein HDS35_07520 [Bacteroides sp.]|nr:hypothetical protein [Bacteroides sp.]